MALCIASTPSRVFSESASGSIYSLDGGVVYSAGDVSGSTYSLSGSGDVIVDSSGGSTYSQNPGVFDGGGTVSVPPAAGGSTGSSGVTGVGYSVGTSGNTVAVQAYSYYKNDLTLIVYLSHPQDSTSLGLVGATNVSSKVILPTNITALNKNTFLIRFSDISASAYALVLGKPAYNIGAPLRLYAINVNQEGNGVVGGPDSVSDEQANTAPQTPQNNSSTGVVTGSGTFPEKTNDQKAVEIKPFATTTNVISKPVTLAAPCTVFGLMCTDLYTIIILFVLILGYIIYKVIVARFAKSKLV